ncbi:MAG: hypothetical protein Q9168_005871 [Polycauliona sp. 1 TL-2023]
MGKKKANTNKTCTYCGHGHDVTNCTAKQNHPENQPSAQQGLPQRGKPESVHGGLVGSTQGIPSGFTQKAESRGAQGGEAGNTQGRNPKGAPGGARGQGKGKGGLNPGYNDKFAIKEGGPDVFTPNGERLETPDEAVHKKEDQLISIGKKSGQTVASLDGAKISARPSYGTKGKPIILRTNYFLLGQTKTELQLFRYTIEIESPKTKSDSPESKLNRRMTRRLVQLVLDNNTDVFKGAEVATDYGTFLVTTPKLAIDGDAVELSQKYYEHEDDGPRHGAQDYKVTIKLDKPVSIRKLKEAIESATGDSFDKDHTIQALNIIMTKTANETSQIYGGGKSNKFYPWPNDNEAPFKLGRGLIALKGFYTSVRSSTARLLVNINVTNAAFYPAINLHHLMNSYTHGKSDFGLEAFITGLKVSHTLYGKKSVRTIKGFSHHDQKHNYPDSGDAYSIKFQCDDPEINRKISVYDYFKKKYPTFPIVTPGAPCVNVGTKERPNFYPPELLTIERGQPYIKKLSGDQTDEMLRFAVRKPGENARRIVEEGAVKMGLSETNKNLQAFGLGVIPKMITVNARVLPSVPVQYKYKGGMKSGSSSTSRGSWNMIDRQFTVARPLSNWTVIKFVDNDLNLADWARFRNDAAATGMEPGPMTPSAGVISKLQHPFDNFENQSANDKEIERIMSIAYENGLKMLLVILPDNNAFNYSRVKFHAEVQFGIHTVCSVGMKLRLKGADYAANLAHKFNLKLGGTNQTIDSVTLGKLHGKTTMVVGMDVTHPSPGSLPESPSIAGVVASVGELFGQWPGSIRAQEHNEMILHLKSMFLERLDHWQDKFPNNLPERIVIYRDGVSEGQYKTLLKDELPQITAACRERYQRLMPPKSNPKITMIVCGKRHHTRFYPTNLQDADHKGQNCQNGTVVDRGVTMEHGWDFFLQAHHCIQGTAKPTHYVVILDENKLGADAVESFVSGVPKANSHPRLAGC